LTRRRGAAARDLAVRRGAGGGAGTKIFGWWACLRGRLRAAIVWV
jgi:hypothetical protein